MARREKPMIGRLDNDAFFARLEGIARSYAVARDEQLAAHPDYVANHDIRLHSFANCISLFGNVSVCMRSALFALNNLDFRGTMRVGGSAAEDDVDEELKEIGTSLPGFLKFACFHGMFSTLEATLRIVMRALDPQACGKGTATFQSVYSCLLSRLKLNKHISLLALMSHMRNLIHNNGAFYPPGWRDVTLTHREREYRFEVGKPVNCLTWDDALDRFDEARGMLLDLFNSEDVKLLPSISIPIPVTKVGSQPSSDT